MQKGITYKDNIITTHNNIDKGYIDVNSEFMIGSVTKLFTLFTILILHSEQKLDIYDTVDKYISSNDSNDFSKITIFQLLNHKSGIINMPDDKFFNNSYTDATSALNELIKENIFINQVGIRNYSSVGYILLGAIIERVTDMKYFDVYKKLIFQRLKLIHTEIPFDMKTNTTLYNSDNKVLSKDDYRVIISLCTSCGLYSCVKDLEIFGKSCISLLNSECLNILKLCDVYTYKGKNHIISHRGRINGGHAIFNSIYDTKWNYIDTNIRLETIKDLNQQINLK